MVFQFSPELWDEYQIKPIIDIGRNWKDGEKTRDFGDTDGVVCDTKGKVFCISLWYAVQKAMQCRVF